MTGVAAGLLALWLLGGQGAGLRYGGALVVALAAGFLVHRASFGSQAKTARCPACGATFSRSRTDRQEALKSRASKAVPEADRVTGFERRRVFEFLRRLTATRSGADLCIDVLKVGLASRRSDGSGTVRIPSSEGWRLCGQSRTSQGILQRPDA